MVMVMAQAQRPRALGGGGGRVWVLRCHEVKIRSTRAGPLVRKEWIMLTAATICCVGKVALADLDKKPTPVELSCFGFAQAALRKTGRDMDLVIIIKSDMSSSVVRSAPTGQFPWHAWLRIC